MNNFIYENKTKVYFGKGGVKEYLGSVLSQYGNTVMLAYGGGSIKNNGVYDEVVSCLKENGKRIVEFSGIMPNPTYAKVQEGAAIANLYSSSQTISKTASKTFLKFVFLLFGFNEKTFKAFA